MVTLLCLTCMPRPPQHFRIMGILQRVSLCYATAASAEILIPEIEVRPTPLAVPPPQRSLFKLQCACSVRPPHGAPPLRQVAEGRFASAHARLVARRAWHWAFGAALVLLWCALTYGVDPGKVGRGVERARGTFGSCSITHMVLVFHSVSEGSR